MELGRTVYARALYDCALRLEPRRVGQAIGAATSRGGAWRCEAFALPVSRVLAGAAGRARFAVQMHFTATAAAAAADGA